MKNCILRFLDELEQPFKIWLMRKFKKYIITIIVFLILIVLNMGTTLYLVTKCSSLSHQIELIKKGEQ